MDTKRLLVINLFLTIGLILVNLLVMAMFFSIMNWADIKCDLIGWIMMKLGRVG